MSSGDAADLVGNPGELAPGPRDHLITRSLRARLNEIGEEFREEEQLDPAEGRTGLRAMRCVRSNVIWMLMHLPRRRPAALTAFSEI
jgi:hypothetical protein